MTVEQDHVQQKLTVRVDRSKISKCGRPALRNLLLRLHIYRCTADIDACRAFYEKLTEPREPFLTWRTIIVANQPAKQIFVQGNTFVENGSVVLKDYEASVKGIIQSWAERAV